MITWWLPTEPSIKLAEEFQLWPCGNKKNSSQKRFCRWHVILECQAFTYCMFMNSSSGRSDIQKQFSNGISFYEEDPQCRLPSPLALPWSGTFSVPHRPLVAIFVAGNPSYTPPQFAQWHLIYLEGRKSDGVNWQMTTATAAGSFLLAIGIAFLIWSL
jgi:hypothetical protein